MGKHKIGVGPAGVAGQALVDQRGKDGSINRSFGDFDLNQSNIARIQLDHVKRGLFKRPDDRILIMTKTQMRVEVFRSKVPQVFEDVCEQLRDLAQRNYVTFQDDLAKNVNRQDNS